MRIEWYDHMAQVHTITSKDPVTLGRWFAEMATYLMSADTRIQGTRIDIWPTDEADIELIGSTHKRIRYTQDDLLEFAQSILDVSAKLGTPG